MLRKESKFKKNIKIYLVRRLKAFFTDTLFQNTDKFAFNIHLVCSHKQPGPADCELPDNRSHVSFATWHPAPSTSADRRSSTPYWRTGWHQDRCVQDGRIRAGPQMCVSNNFLPTPYDSNYLSLYTYEVFFVCRTLISPYPLQYMGK